MTRQITAAERKGAFLRASRLEVLPPKISPVLPLDQSTQASIPTLADTKSLKQPQLSGREQLKCQWELASAIAQEVLSLSHRWAAEIDSETFDPDWDRVFALERLNSLRIWTARTPHGALAGFFVVTLLRGLFTTSVFARIEAGYLAPEWREGSRGRRYIESVVQAIGEHPIEWETNTAFGGEAALVKLLKRLGFRQVGTSMRLG